MSITSLPRIEHFILEVDHTAVPIQISAHSPIVAQQQRKAMNLLAQHYVDLVKLHLLEHLLFSYDHVFFMTGAVDKHCDFGTLGTAFLV